MLAGMPQGVCVLLSGIFFSYGYCMIFGSVLVKILLLISHLILIFVLISNYLEKTPMKKSKYFLAHWHYWPLRHLPSRQRSPALMLV